MTNINEIVESTGMPCNTMPRNLKVLKAIFVANSLVEHQQGINQQKANPNLQLSKKQTLSTIK